jgi:Terminase small subunit
MPPLENIRWERFCQNIVAGVAKNGQKNSQGRAYIAAGYNAKDAGKEGGSAEVAACRLLNHVQIENRIAELLAEAQNQVTKKRRYDIETISERMALASQIAEEDRNPSALYGAEKAIAEVRGLITNIPNTNEPQDFKQCRSMQDIGRKLLQSVGLSEPDDASITAAVEANDAFVSALERIRDAAQGLMIRSG